MDSAAETLAGISVDAVREQLAQLGHDDVSDEVIREFLKQLSADAAFIAEDAAVPPQRQLIVNTGLATRCTLRTMAPEKRPMPLVRCSWFVKGSLFLLLAAVPHVSSIATGPRRVTPKAPPINTRARTPRLW